MVSIDITGRKPRITFFLYEGNFTRNDDMLTDQGPAKGGSYATTMDEYTEVQINTSYDMHVEPLASGVPIGRIANRPEVVKLPKISTIFASLTDEQKRIATVEVDGTIDYVKVVHDNAAIAPGDAVAVATGHKNAYNKEEDAVTKYAYALTTVAQNAGGYVRIFRPDSAIAVEAD